jgi:cytochrome P450
MTEVSDVATVDLPPGPRSPATWQFAEYAVHPLTVLTRCNRRYGDAFTLRFPVAGRMCFFTHPDAIRAIFTASPDVLHAGESNAFLLRPLVGDRSVLVLDGPDHLRERRLLLPPFHGERMRAYATIMRDAADRSLDGWPLERAFAVHPHLQDIALEVILRAVFGVEEGNRFERLRQVIPALLDSIASPALLVPAFLRIDVFKRVPWLSAVRLKAELDALLDAEIAARRSSPAGEDVLSLLLGARDEAGQGLSDDELRGELITMLVAGHETTATALSWALERLAAQSEIAERCREELERVVGNGSFDATHIGRLEYLDAVVRETLRLRPVVPLVGRVTAQTFEIGEWRIPPGVRVLGLLALTQQRDDIYPAPEVFRPERFLETAPGPYEWLPFGGGIRRCIGMAFALYEMKVVLAAVLLRARFAPASTKPTRVGRRHVTLAPADGARIVLTERKLAAWR